MNSTFHQALKINTFDTEHVSFPSELYMEGVILQNPGLVAFDSGSEPDILASQLSFNNNNKSRKLDLIIKVDDNIGIVELKKGSIDAIAYTQINEYLALTESINEKLVSEEIIDEESLISNKHFGLLVGTGIEGSVLREILNKNEEPNSIKIYIIILQQHQTKNDQLFLTSNVLVKPKINNLQLDFTKYSFNGKHYGKGRLVLAVIEDYIKKDNSATIETLNHTFQNTLQGTYSLVKNSKDLENSEKLRKRYFVNNPIQLCNEEEIVVTNQWGIGNIQRFIDVARTLNYIIEPI